MPRYTCSKCGYAIISKNIATRSAFPVREDDQESFIASMHLQAIGVISHVSVVDDNARPAKQVMCGLTGDYSRLNTGRDVQVRITISDAPDTDDTPEKAFIRFIRHFNGMNETFQKQYLCETFGRHDFVADGPVTC